MSPAARHLATVIDLESRRRTTPIEVAPISPRPGVRGEDADAARPGLAYRLAHSPAAADLRDYGWAVGLVLAAVLILIWSLT